MRPVQQRLDGAGIMIAMVCKQLQGVTNVVNRIQSDLFATSQWATAI